MPGNSSQRSTRASNARRVPLSLNPSRSSGSMVSSTTTYVIVAVVLLVVAAAVAYFMMNKQTQGGFATRTTTFGNTASALKLPAFSALVHPPQLSF